MHGGGRIVGMVGLLALMFNLIGMPFDSGAIQTNSHYVTAKSETVKVEVANTLSPIALVNPSFENGFENWFRNGPCNTVTYSGSALHGNWYLASNRNGTEACSSIYQDKTYSVQNSEHYRLAVWVRSANGTPLYGTVALWGLGQNPNQNAKTHFNTVGTGWQCVETIFKPEENHTSLRAEFYLRSLNSEYHFDDVIVREQATSLCPTIPLRNPSFEQGIEGWSASAPCYLNRGTNATFDGTGYLVANRNGSENCYSVSQDTRDIQTMHYGVGGNHTYRLAAWVRSPSGAALNGTLALWGLGWNPNENSSTNFTTTGTGWQCVEVIFRPVYDHLDFRAEIYLKSMNGDYHFDGITIREQATPLCP